MQPWISLENLILESECVCVCVCVCLSVCLCLCVCVHVCMFEHPLVHVCMQPYTWPTDQISNSIPFDMEDIDSPANNFPFQDISRHAVDMTAALSQRQERLCCNQILISSAYFERPFCKHKAGLEPSSLNNAISESYTPWETPVRAISGMW